MTNFNKIFLVTLLISGFALSGCGNTIDGAGRDISNAGGWIQDTF